MRLLVAMVIVMAGCAPAMQGLNPTPLSFSLATDYPDPARTYRKKRRRHRKKRRRRSTWGRPYHRHHAAKSLKKGKKLPAMSITRGPSPADLVKQGLVWAANLVVGIKDSFDDGSFAAYLFYVNDLIQQRTADVRDCVRITTPIQASQARVGDLVVIKDCANTDMELGVIARVCKQGFIVVSYCRGSVAYSLIPAHTNSTKTCAEKYPKIHAKVVGYKTITSQTFQ